MGLWKQIGVAHLGLKTLLKCTTTNDSSAFNSIQQLVTGFDNLSANDLIVYGIVSGIIYARARAKRRRTMVITMINDDHDNKERITHCEIR